MRHRVGGIVVCLPPMLPPLAIVLSSYVLLQCVQELLQGCCSMLIAVEQLEGTATSMANGGWQHAH